MAEIKARGYVGGYSGLAKLLAPWREPAPVRPQSATHSRQTAAVDSQVPAPAWPFGTCRRRLPRPCFGQPRPLLSERQAETVDALKAQCPGFTTMRRLVLSFGTILRVGKVATLHAGWRAPHATNIHPLQRFVRTLRQDLGAVEGGGHRAVEQRAGRRPHQPIENAAAPDVRARRRRLACARGSCRCLCSPRGSRPWTLRAALSFATTRWAFVLRTTNIMALHRG